MTTADILDIVDSAIRFLGVVIWPTMILVVILVFRKQLAPLFPNITKLNLPMMSLELAPPRGIREGRTTQTTGEGPTGAEVTAGAEEFFASGGTVGTRPETLREDIYLVHSATRLDAQTSEGRNWYAVRIWVEADDESIMDRCRRVTYKLHQTFPQPIIATEQRGREFELWIRVWGEFVVLAYLECEGEQPILLSRYLELPGRPPY